MNVTFADKKLRALLENDPTKLKLPASVVESADSKVQALKDVPDLRTLRQWRSLRCKKLKGSMSGLYSIRLNKQYRMLFRVISSVSPASIEIVSIDDYH